MKSFLLLTTLFLTSATSTSYGQQPKATLCSAKATQMATAFFSVNYPNDRLISVDMELVEMDHGSGEPSEEGLGKETWDVYLKVYFEKSAYEGTLPAIEVQLSVDGKNNCLVTNVSMPTAG